MTETQNNIIQLMINSPIITQEELSRVLNVNVRTIQRNIKTLLDIGIVERSGSDKKGEWIVKN